jgi:excisionase family DNA binding protein
VCLQIFTYDEISFTVSYSGLSRAWLEGKMVLCGMTDIEMRLLKLLTAGSEQLLAIDQILAGNFEPARLELKAPLLVGMGRAAEFLGVSRATLWRMIRAGRLEKLEVLPGSFRVRRVDLQKIVGICGEGQTTDSFPAVGKGAER